ncbi:alpha/beta hydrolase [Chloroflexota bacterium]
MASEELELVLKLLRSRPDRTGLTFAEQRAELEAVPGFPLSDDVEYQRVNAAGVPAEWIITPGIDNSRIVYFFHGGGYVLGSINTHREWISRLSRAARAKVFAIDYRLAPENPFPAAVDDAVTAYCWMISTGVDPAKLVIAGSSAGGGLVVSTMVSLRDAGVKLPAAGVCISPWADLECASASITDDVPKDERIVVENLLRMAKAYLGDADPRTPLASPINANLSGLPPLLIQVGTAEGLLDDANCLAERARAQGVDVTLESWEDMIHVWHSFAAVLPEGQQAIDRIGAFVRKHTA